MDVKRARDACCKSLEQHQHPSLTHLSIFTINFPLVLGQLNFAAMGLNGFPSCQFPLTTAHIMYKKDASFVLFQVPFIDDVCRYKHLVGVDYNPSIVL